MAVPAVFTLQLCIVHIQAVGVTDCGRRGADCVSTNMDTCPESVCAVPAPRRNQTVTVSKKCLNVPFLNKKELEMHLQLFPLQEQLFLIQERYIQAFGDYQVHTRTFFFSF